METSADEDTSIKLQDRVTAYGKKFEALKKALDASRRSLRLRGYVNTRNRQYASAPALRVGFETHACLAMRRESSMTEAA